MLIDRKNRWVFVPTTEADKEALREWSKHVPHLQFVEAVDPLQWSLYRRCVISRTPQERLASGLRALVHTDAGRRFASRYHLADFDQALDLLRLYPAVREELLDFSEVPTEGTQVPAEIFRSFAERLGYTKFPSFPTIEPVEADLSPTPHGASNDRIFAAYINVDGHTERAENTEKGLASVGWTAKRISATTPETLSNWMHVEGYADLPRSRQIEHALSVSHLRALQELLVSGCGWGLILEDDIDFESVRAWGFSLEQIPSLLPENCGIFQMMMSWPIRSAKGSHVELLAPESLLLRSHVPNRDWSTGAYLVRREYALHVLHRLRGGKHFDLGRYPGLPVSDVWVYDNTFFSPMLKVYSAPLLYGRDIESTVERQKPQTLMHRASRQFAKNLSAKKGTVQPADVFQPTEAVDYPFVSIITPTYNRRHLLPLLEERILQQNYPRCRMEWIVVDDSQDGQPPFVPKPNTGLTTRYLVLPDKLPLGAKRNFTLSQAKGNICVYMDDDDFYPPTRVNLAVEALAKHPEAHVAGATFMPIYYIEADEYWLAGPWGANHTTAGALAHRRIVFATQKFEATAAYAEEPSFLDGYRLPVVQLNPWQTMTCIAHGTNTYDKRKVLGTKKVVPTEHPITKIIPETLLQTYKEKHRL